MKRIYSMVMLAGLLAGCAMQDSFGHKPQPAAECVPCAPVCAPSPKAEAEEGVLLVVKDPLPDAKAQAQKVHFSPDNLKRIDGSGFAADGVGPVFQMGSGQKFRNVGKQSVDADWWLQIPSDAAVTDFAVDIGKRRFRAVVVEFKRAAELYACAQKQGKHAAILRVSELGWHLFLAQVPPDEVVAVNVVYALMYVDAKQSPPFAARRDGIEFRVIKGEITRLEAVKASDVNPDEFPLIRALWASREINRLLALDRASGRPDHAKEAYEIAREAKIVSPVSSLLLVDAKVEKKAK